MNPFTLHFGGSLAIECRRTAGYASHASVSQSSSRRVSVHVATCSQRLLQALSMVSTQFLGCSIDAPHPHRARSSRPWFGRRDAISTTEPPASAQAQMAAMLRSKTTAKDCQEPRAGGVLYATFGIATASHAVLASSKQLQRPALDQPVQSFVGGAANTATLKRATLANSTTASVSVRAAIDRSVHMTYMATFHSDRVHSLQTLGQFGSILYRSTRRLSTVSRWLFK